MLMTLYTDVHARAKSPPTRVDDYPQTVMHKLRHVINHAEESGALMVHCLGDLFDAKDPSKTPYWLTAALLDLYRSANIECSITLGNHDLQASGIASLDRQPIGVLIKTGALSHWERRKTHDKGVNVVITNHDHHPEIERAPMLIPLPVPGAINVLLAHLPATPEGTHGTISYTTLDALGYDWIIYGHMHETWGCWTGPGGTKIYSLPALVRTSLSTQSLMTPPQYLDLDTTAGTITTHHPPHRPASEIFAIEAHVLLKREATDHKELTEALKTVSLRARPIGDALDEIRNSISPAAYDLLKERLLL